MLATDHPLRPAVLTFARLALLPSLASLLGFLGEGHWLLDLCAHFRWQYVLVIALGLGAALLLRKRGLAGVLACCWLANAFSLASANGPAPAALGAQVTGAAGGEVKLLVANIHLDTADLRPLLALVERESPDVIGIVELTPHAAAALAVLAQRYPTSRIDPREDPFGIGLWSRLPSSHLDLVAMPPLGFPALQLRWPDPGPGSLWLVHPFPPIGAEASAWRDAQLDYAAGLIAGDANAILAGDLNTTPWSASYRRLRERAALSDSAAGRWPWPTWNPGGPGAVLAVPIDHVLHGAAWHSVELRVGPDIGSDHRPLLVRLARAGRIASAQ